MNRRMFLRATAAGALSAALQSPIWPGPIGSPKPPPPPEAEPVNSTLVVCAHEDDDTLAMGATIRAEQAAGKKVYVLMCTDGEATGAISWLNGTGVNSWVGYQHDPAAEAYQTLAGTGLPLTTDDIKAARRAEFERAARTLLVAEVRYLSLPDGGVQAADVQAGIEAYAADIVAANGGLVDVKAHTWVNTSGGVVVEDHPDHLAVGAAAKAVATSAPSWLHSVRYFIVWGLHGSTFPGLTVARVNVSGADAGRVVMARRCYGDWAPEAGRYAIGDHSVHAALAALEADPHSLYHS